MQQLSSRLGATEQIDSSSSNLGMQPPVTQMHPGVSQSEARSLSAVQNAEKIPSEPSERFLTCS
jgi:hypothetical protein